MSEAFVQMQQRAYVLVKPLPDAATALPQIAEGFEDYNKGHPHKGLQIYLPRQHIMLP